MVSKVAAADTRLWALAAPGYWVAIPLVALAYLMIPLVTWAAARLDQRAVTAASFAVSSAANSCSTLKLKVVAEGVETEEQAKILRLLRCDKMQGHLFSKPLPLEQMTALLKASGGSGQSAEIAPAL